MLGYSRITIGTICKSDLRRYPQAVCNSIGTSDCFITSSSLLLRRVETNTHKNIRREKGVTIFSLVVDER
jgi:hypothetical protein